MPSSLPGNPLAMLGPGASPVGPPGPTAMGGAPDGGMGMGGDGGGDQGGGPLPPELMQMALAAQMAPQVLQQQNEQYFKAVLQNVTKLLRALMRAQGIGPKTVGQISRSVTGLQAAMASVDKEKPEEESPVNSLLGASLMGGMSRPQMANAGPMQRLPITR